MNRARLLKKVCLLLVLSMRMGANAETKIVDATIGQVEERGYVFVVGTDALSADDDSNTHFWKNKKVVTRDDFKSGEAVKLRLKSDKTPVILREMADRVTWEWLEMIRKQPVVGVVAKVDDRTVTLNFADGSSFSYRHTAKSDITIGGAKIPATDLKAGTRVYARGRTLPSLDTWLVRLSDTPMIVATKAKGTKKTSTRPRLVQLPSAGAITGIVARHLPSLRMFDVPYQGSILHFGYNNKTSITFDGRMTTPGAIVQGLRVGVTFHRDGIGRIIATKVELFSSAGT